jgi:hypothetical protein
MDVHTLIDQLADADENVSTAARDEGVGRDRPTRPRSTRVEGSGVLALTACGREHGHPRGALTI